MLLATFVAWPVAAQIPDTFTNLRHFPEDISKRELIGKMRGFSFALGVRCQYCHAGGDGVSLDGVDFASDDKPEKRRARYMLEMAEEINTSLLTAVPERRVPNVRVECQTCHRGLPRPTMIDDVLRARIADEGVDAAIAHYRELHDEGYGGWSYNFGEWAIKDLAAEYATESPEIMAALMRMNSEYHPESISVWAGLAGAEARAGNRDAAVAAARKGLELDPENRQILRILESLGIEP